MACTFELTRFFIYCCVLGLLIILCFIFIIIYIIATLIIIRNSDLYQAKEDISDDLKAGSQTLLLFTKRKSKIRDSRAEVVPHQFRDNSLVRKEFDRVALEAIYGADYEIELASLEKDILGSHSRGRVAERANIFENPSVATPTHQLNLRDRPKRRTSDLSKKFQGDPSVPTGLQLKPEKVEEHIEDQTNKPLEPPQVIKPKRGARRYKDPPSVFKGRHQREEFLDVEFAELVDQTNKRLADYTLAGIEESDVQIFANQHLTEKNIKRSKLEFEKTTFHAKGKGIPTRKTSDQKSMLLIAKSVLEDIDFDLAVKKDHSLHSVASYGTETTALSRDDLRHIK